jgi:selenoprotein W-related protein
MAQELLTTFSEEIDELKLVPSTGGIFEIYLNDKLVWSRKERKGFPEITKLKQIVRDEFNPQRSLGHIDR